MEMKTTLSNSFFARFCTDPCVIHNLVDLYAEFNARFFQGELPVLRTVEYEDENGEMRTRTEDIGWDGRYRTVYGKYIPRGKQGRGIIRLARFMAADSVQVRSTLLHEMLHKWLDLKGLDDGIKGHGPNFIDTACDINAQCEEWGLPYRINYYDEAITKEQPEVYSDLLKTTVYCGRDLDVAKRMQSIIRAAFHEGTYEYQQ